MNNFDKVLSMVRNEDEAISAWNKIPASKKGYNPSVNKIISLICEQITSETIRKYDEKYLTPYEFNKLYNSTTLVKEAIVIPYEKGDGYKITTDAKKVIDRLKETSVSIDSKFKDSNYFYKITHNNNCCVISMLCSADIHNTFDKIKKCLNNSGWVITTCRNGYDCGKVITEIVIEPVLLTSAEMRLKNIKFIYHITTEDRIEDIKRNGIIPSRSTDMKLAFCYQEDRAFFSIKNDDEEINNSCKGFVSRILNRNSINENDNDEFIRMNSIFYLITIDASKIDKKHCYCDKHNDNHFFTTDIINPDAFVKIERIKSMVHKSCAYFNNKTKEYDYYPQDEYFYINHS